MADPLAYHITWTTYGTWLPGDVRGWVNESEAGIQAGSSALENQARAKLAQPPVGLTDAQRRIVEATIRKHCEIRGWQLHAINVRTNHVHLVVTAPIAPEKAMGELKAWCARRLNEHAGTKQEWWTKNGSTKWINDENYFENAVRYVTDGQ